nr:TonB-dependent siderophore receptor [uncultured Devosia sp.]
MTTLSRGSLAGLLLVSTALITGHAFAQAPIALGEVVVEADENGATTVSTTAGSKLTVAVTEVPQSVSVVSREQLDNSTSQKADAQFNYTAGVNGQTYGEDSDTDWLFIRGFNAGQTGMFLDNLSLYQYGFGTFVVDPFLLDRIEVVKGPASVLYGGANVGGIVNYVSKRPTGERFLYTETGVNNFGNAYVGIDGGDVVADGDLSYRLTGKLSGGGWETDDASDLRGVVQGSATWTPSDETSLTLYGSYQNVDLDHTSTGFLPYVGTVVDAPGGIRIPRDLNYGEPAIDIYERQQFMVGYELEHDINGDWTVRQNARYAAVDLTEDAVYASGRLNGTLLDRNRFAHETHAGILTVDNQLEGQFATGPIDHTLLLGFDYKNYRIDPKTFYNASVNEALFPGTTPSIDIFNPAYGLGYTPITLAGTATSLNQAGLYAQDQMKLDNWILTLNGRYDFATTTLEQATEVTRDEGIFTGRVGLGYEFDNGLTPYVSYGTSFNPQLSQDVDNNLLASEKGEQWEAGIKYEPTFMDGLITASVFNINRSNVAAPSQIPNTYYSVPVGEVNVTGVELEALVNVEDFKILGSLTYLDAEVINSTNAAIIGKTPVQIPTLTASLGVEYDFGGQFEGLTVGAGARYLGASWADDTNTLEVPAATVFDASLRYEQDDWGVTLAASNIFDKTYVASCQGASSCGYGAGRTVTLSLHKSW